MSPWTEGSKIRGYVELEQKRGNETIWQYCAPNVVHHSGMMIAALLLTGETSILNAYLALGSGQVTHPSNSLLAAEYTTAGLVRAQAVSSNVTVTNSNDTAQFVYTWTCLVTAATVTEEAFFDQLTSTAGDLIASQTFAAVNMATGDTLKVTHKLTFS